MTLEVQQNRKDSLAPTFALLVFMRGYIERLSGNVHLTSSGGITVMPSVETKRNVDVGAAHVSRLASAAEALGTGNRSTNCVTIARASAEKEHTPGGEGAKGGLWWEAAQSEEAMVPADSSVAKEKL